MIKNLPTWIDKKHFHLAMQKSYCKKVIKENIEVGKEKVEITNSREKVKV